MYKLELLPEIKVHPIFHVSLLDFILNPEAPRNQALLTPTTLSTSPLPKENPRSDNLLETNTKIAAERPAAEEETKPLEKT